jgi:hypothetical protein
VSSGNPAAAFLALIKMFGFVFSWPAEAPDECQIKEHKSHFIRQVVNAVHEKGQASRLITRNGFDDENATVEGRSSRYRFSMVSHWSVFVYHQLLSTRRAPCRSVILAFGQTRGAIGRHGHIKILDPAQVVD